MSELGPAWVGIGAQRSGTTWLTSLLRQHPRVELASGGGKELHAFDHTLVEPWTDRDTADYRRRFPDDGLRRGEFTPFYLRGLWIPPVARRACPDDVVLVVALRDPVERFASAMRWYVRRRWGWLARVPPLVRRWVRQRGPDAQWGGMYAAQLRAWTEAFPAEQIVVIQYERAHKDPQAAVDRVWAALGLEPVALSDVTRPSVTSTRERWAWATVPGLHERLVACYRPQLDELQRDWGIDPALWPSLT